MVDLYTAICMQVNRSGINHKKEIRKANLERALELIEFSVKRLGFPDYAPVKLILFPEVFMQGWCDNPAPYPTIWEKAAKDIAIEIPGEETDLLAEKAKQYGVYIAGSALEFIPKLRFAFNAGFIIDPRGEVIYKYHKHYPVIQRIPYGYLSPHDVYDKYIEVMDGQYGRKKGDILSCFFPVIETAIGKLGYIVCNDGFNCETSRAMGIQGCEVMMRSSGNVEPFGSPPQQNWEIQNRAAAGHNIMYVVACAPGDLSVKGQPTNYYPGQSMIIDFHGALLQNANYPGETVTGATIDVENLRKRRLDARWNWMLQMRAEVFQEMYRKPVYPKNLFADRIPTPEETIKALPVQRFLKERVFIAPSKGE